MMCDFLFKIIFSKIKDSKSALKVILRGSFRSKKPTLTGFTCVKVEKFPTFYTILMKK